jgi:upstream activation factor subunit UAF30
MVAPALLLLIMADELEHCGSVNEQAPDAGPVRETNRRRPQGSIETELKADLRKADADKKAATKKVPPKATSAKTPAKAAKRRTPNAAFMSPLHCSAPLQAVVGGEALPRVEIVSRLWAYIKKHKLQDNVNKRMVNCDEKLKAIFGKAEGQHVRDGRVDRETRQLEAVRRRCNESARTDRHEAREGQEDHRGRGQGRHRCGAEQARQSR